jgi:hypothetical protein
LSTIRRDSIRRRKRPIPPSGDHHVTAFTTLQAEPQPLFLPEPDEEQGSSTSTRTPLFLPEEREDERPKKKKRRISSKVPQLRTLNDLWRPRQVSKISFDL